MYSVGGGGCAPAAATSVGRGAAPQASRDRHMPGVCRTLGFTARTVAVALGVHIMGRECLGLDPPAPPSAQSMVYVTLGLYVNVCTTSQKL